MNYVAESVAINWLGNDVNVVWHDAPSEHAIAFTIEVQDDVLDQLCDGWLAEPAGS